MTKDEIFLKIDDIYCENDGGDLYLTKERENLIKEIIQQAIDFIPCCKSVKNIENETPLDKIKALTNALETFRNIPYTTDAIITTIKKIDKLIDEL